MRYLMPILLFLVSLWFLYQSASTKNKHQQRLCSKTRYLHLWREQANGILQGRVLRGTCKGQLLNGLSFQQLLELLEEYQQQHLTSANTLTYYLDQRFAATWRQRAKTWQQARSSIQAFSRAEAYQILGLAPGAAKGEIKKAYRRRMQKAHPDQGGSTEQAILLNQAKAILLGNAQGNEIQRSSRFYR